MNEPPRKKSPDPLRDELETLESIVGIVEREDAEGEDASDRQRDPRPSGGTNGER
jgi:hypothetical protein